MKQEMDIASAPPVAAKQKTRSSRAFKSVWRKVRKPIANSAIFKHGLAATLTGYLRLVKWTSPLVPGSDDLGKVADESGAVIVAMWHGQHIMCPVYKPRAYPITAMFSRSADAEINALVARRLGLDVVRGSGGRAGTNATEKGGARALVALKRILERGETVAMIADIPHGTPREAGLGIVTLARLSGRPVVPYVVATSRRKVLEKSWDKTTINLPFGRAAAIVGEFVHVPADADAAQMEEARQAVTRSLEAANEKAYRLLDGA